MPRIRLQERYNYNFKEEIQVRVYDLNVANHVGNSEIANIIHEARSLVFRKFNVVENNLGDGETGIVIADMVLNYISEAFLGDILLVEMTFDEINENSFRVFYRITDSGKLVTLAETGIVAFDYKNRKKGTFPDSFLKEIMK